MTTTERLEALRTEGNALFSAKDFARAVDKYSEGLAAAEAAAKDAPDTDRRSLDEQRVLLWNNRAACFLQLQQFACAVEDCSRALAADATNAKARYRRAQAHVGLGHFTDAFQDVRLVLQLTPNNKAAVALARKIKEAVQDDANGVQKALDTIADCMADGATPKRLAEDQTNKKQIEDAFIFLEMKAHAELSSVPAEIARRGGLAIVWRTIDQLLDVLALGDVPAVGAQDSALSIVAHAVGLLSVIASASVEVAGRVFDAGLSAGNASDDNASNGIFCVIQLLHAQTALEYKEPDAEAGNASTLPHGRMALRGRKAIVKLCAFVFKYLMVASATDDVAAVNEAHVRRVFDGLLHGLRSREVELQIAALDGLLHFISVTSATSSATATSAAIGDDTRRRLATHFATLIQELGVFPLLHSTAAGALHVSTDTASIHIVLSRLPLVFTQCLAQLEGKDGVLKRLVSDYCVTPVMEARVSDRASVESASSACLLLSALFLSNAKLALWAVQQTITIQDDESTPGSTAFLGRIYKLLDASRTWASTMNYSRDHTRRLQEIWVDSVASVCGVENGASLVPPVLRVEMYKMLRAALDDDDLALRASALSIQVKIAIVEKTLELDTVDGQFLIDSVFDVLEGAHGVETKQREAIAAASSVKGKKATPQQQEAVAFATWSTRTSPKERAIEALSYLITQTEVKEAFVKRPNAVKSVFAVEFPSSSSSTPHVGYRSNVYYGIGYILHHTLTSESALKKKQMEGMEMTAEQYEELQKALKQKSVLDDGDSPEKVHVRVQKLAASRDVLTTLVQLLKFATTRSENVLEMAVLSALNASEVPQVRGSLVQCGVFQSLIPLSLHSKPKAGGSDAAVPNPKVAAQQHGTTISNAAGQALARILISTNPNLIPSSSLLSSVKPLLQLCKGETQLLQFEALMALTNVASVSDETKSRIVAEPQGLSTLQYLQFSEHELVRRAATEAICNLLPNDEVIEKVFLNEERLRLWLALSSAEEEEEDFETARAAGGALAMVSQVPAVSWLLMKQGGLATFSSVLETSTNEETLHRALFAVENMIGSLSAGLADQDEEKRKEATAFAAELSTRRTTLTSKLAALAAKSGAVQEAARSCLAAINEVK